jgi:EAL domain-containing protein (putative c-di-GMP-specific phosphodiesterase class I)
MSSQPVASLQHSPIATEPFLFARPMPADEFAAWLADNEARVDRF